MVAIKLKVNHSKTFCCVLINCDYKTSLLSATRILSLRINTLKCNINNIMPHVLIYTCYWWERGQTWGYCTIKTIFDHFDRKRCEIDVNDDKITVKKRFMFYRYTRVKIIHVKKWTNTKYLIFLMELTFKNE